MAESEEAKVRCWGCGAVPGPADRFDPCDHCEREGLPISYFCSSDCLEANWTWHLEYGKLFASKNTSKQKEEKQNSKGKKGKKSWMDDAKKSAAVDRKMLKQQDAAAKKAPEKEYIDLLGLAGRLMAKGETDDEQRAARTIARALELQPEAPEHRRHGHTIERTFCRYPDIDTAIGIPTGYR